MKIKIKIKIKIKKIKKRGEAFIMGPGELSRSDDLWGSHQAAGSARRLWHDLPRVASDEGA